MVNEAIALATEVYRTIMKSLPTQSFNNDRFNRNNEVNDKALKCPSSHSYCPWIDYGVVVGAGYG